VMGMVARPGSRRAKFQRKGVWVSRTPNKRITFARCARPTRKSEAFLLAAQAGC
jgi:hypothetical protein